MGDNSSPNRKSGSGTLIASDNWSTLKKSFSADILFRFNYFSLVNGDFRIMEGTENRWFPEKLIEYAGSNYDINLLPALKKISENARYDDNLRYHASGIKEVLENYKKVDDFRRVSTPGSSEAEKIFNSRALLAGVRAPQTIEILRLLREKSPEIRRIALYLIGKFRITDFLKETCECLNTPGLENAAYSVLHYFGDEASRDLRNFYIASSGNVNTSCRIMMLLSDVPSEENLAFIYSRLWSNSRKIRELSLKMLAGIGYKIPETENDQIETYIYNIFNLLAWILTVKICLYKNNDHFLLAQMEKEYRRWKTFLLNFLDTVSFTGPLKDNTGKTLHDRENGIKIISELKNILFKEADISNNYNGQSYNADRKMLKKLGRYFPCEPAAYDQVHEDLINSDYNRISIWTKATALRSLKGIREGDPAQSVIALLFSPERILREEAGKLLEGAGSNLNRSVVERAQDLTRRIPENKFYDENKYTVPIFDKVKFLSSCFPLIPEEELIGLAERVIAVRGSGNEITATGEGFLIWPFGKDNTGRGVTVLNTDYKGRKTEISMGNDIDFCYILPLKEVEAYIVDNPENAFQIAEYIDNHEE